MWQFGLAEFQIFDSSNLPKLKDYGSFRSSQWQTFVVPTPFLGKGGGGMVRIRFSGKQKPSSVLKTLTECRLFRKSVKSSFEAITLLNEEAC